MRIALAIERFDTNLGGEQVWVDGFARFLARQNHDVHIVTFLDQSRDLPAKVHLLPDPGNIRQRALHIDAYLATLAADVVHDSGAALKADIYQPACGSAAFSESRFMSAFEMSTRVRAAISPRAIWRRMQLHRIENNRVMGARRVITPSKLVADLLVRQHGVARSNISVVPNGVDSSQFDSGRFDDGRDATRAEFGIGKEQIVFLMVANNLLLKGADVSIKALALLHSQGHTNSHLVIAGGQPERIVQRVISETNMRHAITFLGYVPDVARLMNAADAFLHPTRWDTCSLVTSEAMASGLPVITSGMNGAAELISSGVDGLVCRDPEDVEAIAAHMTRLMDPTFRREVGKNARHSIKRFDAGRNYAEVERHLSELAAKHRR